MLGDKKVTIRTATEFDAVPMDRYTAQIVDVNLLEKQRNNFNGKEEDLLNYQFVILDDKPMPDKTDEAGKITAGGITRGKFLWHKVTPVINDRSWWGQMIKAVIGRVLTKEEKLAFDPESLVGKQVDVMVVQNPSKDGERMFNNIKAYNKTVKPLTPVEEKPQSTQKVVENSSVPVTAPADAADKFLADMDAEGKAPDNAEAAEAEVEELELAQKLAAAKAKVAKLKAVKK